ncbi:hypothetical protein DPMN_101889 [Dreissena polymorpha]|uniref:Uncharacterized protein n=1 Tax=Dreissena polymorpha TaxID=45954 RepID=A0A9D4LK77_DREPO|nr:hypothetical protein DPMN_101889 [Dreissena polymorpha]
MTRLRPGHWPKQDTPEQENGSGMFLVHPGMIGHYYSNDSVGGEFASAQWRMSTTKIAQLLVFDQNLVQMKKLIVFKTVRK